ncbi:MAG: FkbM family methyltransferase [Hyphomicrobiales bacterium]|nr:FkbM family methyltransferase [Hyphomicrobiales bacterium]
MTSRENKIHVPSDAGDIHTFVEDIIPYFIDKAFVYIDIGAHHGDVFAEFCASRLRLREAHLIEPNPDAFAVLKRKHEGNHNVRYLHFHNLAVGLEAGELAFRKEGGRTRVIEPAGPDFGEDPSGALFNASAMTLDAFAGRYDIKHVSLLKVDVEGFELEVLKGAEQLLSSSGIDMVYIEAGIDPNNNQQTYYRLIEDELNNFDYNIFRIYDQVHETFKDKPILRRVNLAFISKSFAIDNPARATKRRHRNRVVTRALKEEISAKNDELTMLTTENEELRRRLNESEQRFTDDVSRLSKSLAAFNGAMAPVKSDVPGPLPVEQTAAKVLEILDRHADEVARLEEALTRERSKMQTVREKRKELRRKLTVLRSSRKTLLEENVRLSKRLAAITSTRAWRLGSVLFGGHRIRRLTGPDRVISEQVSLAGGGESATQSTVSRSRKVGKRPRSNTTPTEAG